MATTARSRRADIARKAGGLLAPFALAALTFVLLRTGTRDEQVEMSTVVASVFVGFVTFDLATAAGMAASRSKGGGAGKYSSLVGMTVLFWFFWVATTAVTTGRSATWTANTAAALAVGGACLVVEFLGVRRLGRVEKPSRAS